MTFPELKTRVADMQMTKAWLFEKKRDAPLTPERLSEIEKSKGVMLDGDYRLFLTVYGAGQFAFADIYSPDPESPWSAWQALETCHVIPKEFIPLTDNGAGDFLGFRTFEGRTLRQLFWADHEQDYQTSESEYGSFLEFLTRWALRIEERTAAHPSNPPPAESAGASSDPEI
jgi:hypothetical protein